MSTRPYLLLHVALLLALASIARPGAAQSAYCRKMQARADGDAALLTWPRLTAAALRFAGAGEVELGPTFGGGYQARLGLSASPTDIARGVHVQRVAEADCRQHEAAEPLRELLLHGLSAANLTALQAQAFFLSGRQTQWRAIAERGDELLAAGLITAVQQQALRRFVSALEYKLGAVQGQASVLQSGEPALPDQPLPTLVDAQLASAIDLERERAALRALDPWNLKVSGGVIPVPGGPPDWYGALELSYSLGSGAHDRAEREEQSARAAELRSAAYEIRARVKRLQAQARVQLEHAKSELGTRGRELTVIRDALRALDASSVPAADYTRATLSAEQIMIESELVFYHGLTQGLTRFLDGTS